MALTHQCPPGVDQGAVKLSFQPHLDTGDLAELDGKTWCAEDTFLPESACNLLWGTRSVALTRRDSNPLAAASADPPLQGLRLRVVHAWHHGCVPRTAGPVAGPGLTWSLDKDNGLSHLPGLPRLGLVVTKLLSSQVPLASLGAPGYTPTHPCHAD